MKQIIKILLIIILTMIIIIKKTYAEEFTLERLKYDDVYAVYDGPDRVHLYEAERYVIDGKTAYCIEPGAPIKSNWYQSTEDITITGLDKDTLDDIKLIAYFGYNYNNTQNTRNYYLATQELIWKRIANRNIYWIIGTDKNGPRIDLSSEIARINMLVEKYKTLPSFNGEEYEMRVGDEATIWDMNYVLSDYEIYETDLPNVRINGPYLEMKATSPHEVGSIKFKKESNIPSPVLIYFNGNNQKLLTSGKLSPIYAELKINVKAYPRIKIVKIDAKTKEQVKIPNIKFKIKNTENGNYLSYPSTGEIFKTDETGTIITPMELYYGSYQLEEVENQNIEGYLWNNKPLKFVVDENSDYHFNNRESYIELKFENEPVKGKLIVNKLGEQMTIQNNEFTYHEIKVDGVAFDLYQGKNLITSFETINGTFTVDNLALGSYCLKETTTVANHEINEEPYCFELKYKDELTPVVIHEVTLKNHIPKGTFMLTKLASDTSLPLPGATIEIYDEFNNLLVSKTTDESGQIIVESLPKGKYYYLEISSPEGYKLSDTKEYFEITKDKEIVKANFINEKIIVPDTNKTYKKLIKYILLLVSRIISPLYVKKNINY